MSSENGGETGDLIHLLCFSLDDQTFALPVRDVEKVMRAVAVSVLPDSPDIIIGVVNVRGKILPVADMRRRLSLPPKEYGIDDSLLWVTVAGRGLLLIVDAVLGVQALPKNEIIEASSLPQTPPLVKGIARLPGGLLIIQNLAELLNLEQRKVLEDALAHY